MSGSEFAGGSYRGLQEMYRKMCSRWSPGKGLVQDSSWSQCTGKSMGPVLSGVKMVHGTETNAMVFLGLQFGT